jgi:hypothetical protein
MIVVLEIDDVVPDVEDADSDFAELSIEVRAQGLTPTAVSAHLHIVSEKRNEGVEVTRVRRPGITIGQLTDRLDGEQSFYGFHASTDLFVLDCP